MPALQPCGKMGTVTTVEVATADDMIHRVARLSKFFDVDEILQRTGDPDEIRSYYTKSAIGYALFHSRHGSIHMALNPDGTFDELGYYRAPELAWDAVSDAHVPHRTLELGCGNGFNLDLIASQAPDSTFVGVDLVPKHARQARRHTSERSNVAIVVGDFQQLQFPDAYFGGAYSIESFCHARSPEKAFDEAARVLRPGARFVVIDAWRTGSHASPELERALKLTEMSMSVSAALTQSEWIRLAKKRGFRVRRVQELSSEVLPNLERFERLAEKFMARKRIARVLARRLGLRILENVIAGYLMAESVRAGHHRYDMIVLERK